MIISLSRIKARHAKVDPPPLPGEPMAILYYDIEFLISLVEAHHVKMNKVQVEMAQLELEKSQLLKENDVLSRWRRNAMRTRNAE